MTPSAWASNIGGAVRPKAFAVLRLMTQLELGRLSPLTVEIDPVTNAPMAS